MIPPRSPTPPLLIRESQLSVSSRSSLSGDVKLRKKIDPSPPLDYPPTIASPSPSYAGPPSDDFDMGDRKKRKKKDKKHKKDRKSKKKKKKSKHRSRSTSVDSAGGFPFSLIVVTHFHLNDCFCVVMLMWLTFVMCQLSIGIEDYFFQRVILLFLPKPRQ